MSSLRFVKNQVVNEGRAIIDGERLFRYNASIGGPTSCCIAGGLGSLFCALDVVLKSK